MKEEWRDIIEYEGYYQISNKGRVRSLDRYIKSRHSTDRLYRGKILSLSPSKYGYIRVSLWKNGKNLGCSVHRLVAKAFIFNSKNKLWINHIDGNKMNNNKENLEWVTRSENMSHAFRTGLCKPRIGHESKSSKCTKTDVINIRNLYKTKKYTQQEIADFYNVSNATISRIIKKVTYFNI